MTELILTWGSRRQSAELAALVDRSAYVIEHVAEEGEPGVARALDDLVADGRAILRRHGGSAAASILLGRATVHGGIPAAATAWSVLRRELRRPDATRSIGPPAHAAAVLNDKWLTSQTCASLGIPVPETVLLDDDACVTATLPGVVKARTLTGGAGIRYVRTDAELREHVAMLRQHGLEPPIVTELVEGLEVSIEILRLGDEAFVLPTGCKGLTTTAMRHADDKVKVFGHLELSPFLRQCAVGFAEALEVQGLFSVEAVLVDGAASRWKVLEAAARVTGNLPVSQACVPAFDAFGAIARYVDGQPWAPTPRVPRLGIEVPLYGSFDACTEWSTRLRTLDWIVRAVVDDLLMMPFSDRTDCRVRAGFACDDAAELAARCQELDALCPGQSIAARVEEVLGEIDAHVDVERVASSPLRRSTAEGAQLSSAAHQG